MPIARPDRGMPCPGRLSAEMSSNEEIMSSADATSFTGPHHFQMDQWISCAPFERLLSMEIIEAAGGRAVLTMPFLLDFSQGAGIMHGGAILSLADTAVVMAIKSVLAPMTHFGTVSMESSFLRPVRQGIITARARVVGRHGRTFRGEATVVDEEGKEVLAFSSVFKVARDERIRGVTFKT